MNFINIEQAVEDLKEGKIFVMVDAEDREDEGDTIFLAQFSTKGKVSFAMKEARGVLCITLDENLARKFKLPLMVPKDTSSHEIAFTITVDTKKATTDVSAYERDMTVEILADGTACVNSFVRPGHISPLTTKKGGVLERTGHIEGNVGLCHLAGLKGACVVYEIIKGNGDMARRGDLLEFYEEFKLNMVTVSDLIEYHLKNESSTTPREQQASLLAGFKVQKFIFEDHNQIQHIAFCFNQPGESENIKFHISGGDFELSTPNKFSQLLEQVQFLPQNSGVIIFIQGEKSSTAQFKNYGIGARILGFFKIKEVHLMSQNCDRDFIALKGSGLNTKACQFKNLL